jgi:Ca2+-binding EF-hand superfamily protein
LKACFEELGASVKDAELKAMVAESKGPLDFKAFLGLFEAKMGSTDSESAINDAFKTFDNSGSGKISKDL